MGGNEERLQHADYPRDGYKLDVGRLWEIDCGAQTMRELDVYASADNIRIVNMWCGEWEMAERAAVNLNIAQARALGEVLLAAADVTEWQARLWRTHSTWADPGPRLGELMDEHIREVDREREAEVSE